MPLRVFPLKWRSREYEKLLHTLDSFRKERRTHPLLHVGPVGQARQSKSDGRVRVRAPQGARKVLLNSCPSGKPLQFYDTEYLREAKAHGLLRSLRVKTAYPHDLPRA